MARILGGFAAAVIAVAIVELIPRFRRFFALRSVRNDGYALRLYPHLSDDKEVGRLNFNRCQEISTGNKTFNCLCYQISTTSHHFFTSLQQFAQQPYQPIPRRVFFYFADRPGGGEKSWQCT
jgi:hypothetical protein